MNISERNRKNIISRWRKIHNKDIDYLTKKGVKFPHLKSRLFGFIAGDGNILFDDGKCRHNTLRFFPDHPSMIFSFEEAMIKVYNKKPKVKKKENYFWVTLDSKPIVNDFLNYGNFGKMEWAVPSIVFNSLKNKIEFLRAFFDCGAYVHKDHIMVKSVNKKGLKQVKELLNDFEINVKMYSYKPKNLRHNINYMLIINRKADRKKYLKNIGFNHTIKLKKLKESLNIN